jgi:hypothetical protein
LYNRGVIMSGAPSLSHRLVFASAFVAARVALDLVFVFGISQLFAYMGLTLQIGPAKLAASYVVTLALARLLPARCARPSDFLVLLLACFILLPCLSLWSLRDLPTADMAVILGAYLLTVLGALPVLSFGPACFWGISFVLAASMGLLLWRRGALGFFNLNLLDVYSIRKDVHEQVIFGFMGYLVPWYGKVIGVAWLSILLAKGRWAGAAVIAATEFVLFAVTAHKEYLFYPVLLIGIFVLTSRVERLNYRFLGVVTAALVATLLLYLIGDFWVISGFVAYRSFFAIALNHFEYLSFFHNNPYVYFSNSVLAPIADYPFNAPVPALVGSGRYGVGREAFANTGYIASGYMQLGALGALWYGLLVGLLLRVFDSLVADRLSLRLGIMFTTVPILQLANTDLTVALVTNGLLLTVLLLLLYPGTRAAADQDADLPSRLATIPS